MTQETPPLTATSGTAGTVKADLPAYDARGLVNAEGKALLILDSETYTLKITRNEKLILTK